MYTENTDFKKLRKESQERRQKEHDIEDRIYLYISDKLVDDYVQYVRYCYDLAHNNFGLEESYEEWYDGCIFNPCHKEWRNGISDYLGDLQDKGKFQEYMEKIDLVGFVDSITEYGDFEVRMNYRVEGSGVWSYPMVYVNVSMN